MSGKGGEAQTAVDYEEMAAAKERKLRKHRFLSYMRFQAQCCSYCG